MSWLKNFIYPLLWVCVIFTLSMNPFGGATTYGVLHHIFYLMGIHVHGGRLEDVNFLVRKSAHLTVYAVLAALWFRALRKSGMKLRPALAMSLAIAFSCGALDEFHQSFEPGRTSKFSDVLIDTAGAGAALFMNAIAIKKRRGTCAAQGTTA